MENETDFDLYIIDYEFEGSIYGINIPANSWEEAQARAKALTTAKVVGRIPLDAAE